MIEYYDGIKSEMMIDVTYRRSGATYFELSVAPISNFNCTFDAAKTRASFALSCLIITILNAIIGVDIASRNRIIPPFLTIA